MINAFIEAIKTEQRRIQRLISLSTPLNTKGRGHLKLSRRHSGVYAYERWQGNGQPERYAYLGTPDSPATRELFSLRFKKQRLVRLQHDQALLQKLVQQYQPYDFASIVADMPVAYRKVAKDDSFDARYEELRVWAGADYPKNPFPFPESENYAADGTRLRSKGECIFYNLLQGRGILFRNDCALTITDYNGEVKTLYPDFLIQCFDGTFIIIEHLGKMGNFGYAMDFGKRSHLYFLEGFVLGKNYFVTSDDPHYGTDSQMIAQVVDRIEEMFFGF